MACERLNYCGSNTELVAPVCACSQSLTFMMHWSQTWQWCALAGFGPLHFLQYPHRTRLLPPPACALILTLPLFEALPVLALLLRPPSAPPSAVALPLLLLLPPTPMLTREIAAPSDIVTRGLVRHRHRNRSPSDGEDTGRKRTQTS